MANKAPNISSVLRSYCSQSTDKYNLPSKSGSNFCSMIGKCSGPNQVRRQCSGYRHETNQLARCLDGLPPCMSTLNVSHKVISVHQNVVTVQLQLYSLVAVENLAIFNTSVIGDKRIFLIDVVSHHENLLPISVETACNDFHRHGRLTHEGSHLAANCVQTLVYRLCVVDLDCLKDKVEIKGSDITPVCSQSIVNLTYKSPVNDSEKEIIKIDHTRFGCEQVLCLKDGSQLFITNWHLKPCYNKVYVSFELLLKSICNSLYEVNGITGNGCRVPLFKRDTVCTQRITAKIGHEFDARKGLSTAKLDVAVRCIELVFIKRICPKGDTGKPDKPTGDCKVSRQCKCQCSKYFAEITELVEILSKLRILRLNVTSDKVCRLSTPSVYTRDIAKCVCQKIQNARFLQVGLDSNDLPVTYSLTSQSKTFFENERVVAIDSNGFQYSICCLTLSNCAYIKDDPKTTTFLMAICQLEKLLGEAVCEMLKH